MSESKKISGYLKALQPGNLAYYHDLQDYRKGRLNKETFKKRWVTNAKN